MTTNARPHKREDPATFDFLLDESELDDDRLENARNIAEWVIVLCVAFLSVVILKATLIQPFWIPTGSMEPTLMVGDRIIVSKVAYRFGDISHGDIVVFKAPPKEKELDPTITHLVKRVIGLPGDTIRASGGLLYRNGQIVSETYLPPGTLTVELPETKVPEGQLFLMGDNRGNSQDSRFFGTVDENLVVGKAVFRFWPLTEFGGV